jgi:hypothetical protein
MRKILLIFCLLFFTTRLFAQQFAQYNTGTLYDSFENPAQRSFIPDSSRQYAFNFLIPNFDANFLLTGDAQESLKNRAFNNVYNNKQLQVDAGKYNHFSGSANAYSLMFKIFTSLNGNSEVGFFTQSRVEGNGVLTDASISLFNGAGQFQNRDYDNILNSNFRYQAYNEIGFTYREQITKQFAFGIKVASVSGIANQNLSINQSSISFDKVADTARMYLQGKNYQTDPTVRPFSNPGAAVSIGTLYKTQDGFILQANIKNLGFIDWNNNARVYNFNNFVTITGLSTAERENNVYAAIKSVDNNNPTYGSYTTPLDGTAELSVSRSYFLDDEKIVKYAPTLIASKELFYPGFTAAMVNPILYKNYTVSITTSYNDLKLLTLGGQFMIKSANAEFFIGSDRLYQTGSMVLASFAVRSQVYEAGSFSGADFFLGASFKFGPVIEHPMNASTIPMGEEKGFLGKLWDKVFNPNKDAIRND